MQFSTMIAMGKDSSPVSIFCRWLGWTGTQLPFLQMLKVFKVRKEGPTIGKQLTTEELKETGF